MRAMWYRGKKKNSLRRLLGDALPWVRFLREVWRDGMPEVRRAASIHAGEPTVIVVPGSGPTPCDYMIVGEAPGITEAKIGRPFVGKSGAELNWYLGRHGMNSNQFYLDNVVRLYQDGNPDPTAEQITEWTHVLQSTIATVRPKVIIPVGRFAVRWFLGDHADMDSCHGIPHLGGEFDPTRADRAQGAVIVPSYHPAAGLHSSDFKTVTNFDIGKAAEVIRLVKGGRRDLIRFRRDTYAGREHYTDVTGHELAAIIRKQRPERVGFDTEGDPDLPWSLQVSWDYGTGYVLRCRQPDFHVGVEALQWLADNGCVFATHDAGTPRGTGYDIQVSRTCGLHLSHATFSNTMYRAFALRIEPKGLKPLLWRWCGMRQDDYWGMVEEIGRKKQIDYLTRIASKVDWGRVSPRIDHENDGTLKLNKFGKLESRARGILTDVAKDKRSKDGDPVDPRKRWLMIEPELRKLAESDANYGKLPFGTLDDVDLDTAIYYAGRDADGTNRLDIELTEECIRMGVDGVCQTGNQVLPIFEEMQHEGMPASRRAFVDLASTVNREMHEIQAGLSTRYFDGRPFNPAPNTKDVETLVRRLGITGLKTTKKAKKVSTSMRSLEYLAPKYPAIKEVGEWRRRQKVLDTYCLPLIEMADRQFELESRKLEGDSDLFIVRGNIKPVSVETRRLAMSEPSLLNQPSRTEIGKKVRACYMTTHDDDPDDPETEVFVGIDYSAQEVRVTAHVTGDRLLCSIVSDPTRKIHYETASRVFGKPLKEVDKDKEMTPAKTAYFGMIYGLSGAGLLDLFRSFGLDTWDLASCDNLIAEILRIYPGIQETRRRVEQEARRTGMIRDLYGHIRYLPGIWSGNRGEQSEAARQAFSHVIQGTAQGMTQCAMASLRKPIHDMQLAGLFVRYGLQIHDEIIMRTRRWLFHVLYKVMELGMTTGYGGPGNLQLKVPVLVDAHMSTQWSTLK